MQVGVLKEFKADRREPLGAMIRRVAAHFDEARISPTIIASFLDRPLAANISAIDRALKKFPHLVALQRDEAATPGGPSVRRLTNYGGHSFPMADVLALADGVPRSLPFHEVTVQLRHESVGDDTAGNSTPASVLAVTIQDGWWVTGRTRALTGLYSVEADPASKKLPDPPEPFQAVLAALGKPRTSRQVMLDSDETKALHEAGRLAVARDSAALAAVAPIVDRYRSLMPSFIEDLRLPHDLPPEHEALRRDDHPGGPLKPALVHAFASRGFDCKGGSGIFTLQRRTSDHHVVELDLDVGKWGRWVDAILRVRGPGFTAALEVPVTARAQRRQYPIRDAENWKQVVDNLAAIVDGLERTFVREVEEAVGPAPAWFDPGRA